MKFLMRLIKKDVNNTDDIDGGVRIRTSRNAPKVIHSTTLIDFDCRFSTRYSLCQDIEKDIFSFKAKLKDGKALVYNSKDKRWESPDFLDKVQEIISKYNLAEHNGYGYFVSGISNEYGATLSALYQSGEKIYATDNQHCFLPIDAMKELIALFK